MKLTIEIDDSKYIKSYLSVVSLGVLECLEKGLLDFDDAINMVYFLNMVDRTKVLSADLSDAILWGTQLEDVYNHVPHKMKLAIEDIRKLNYKSIELAKDNEQHVFYTLEK